MGFVKRGDGKILSVVELEDEDKKVEKKSSKQTEDKKDKKSLEN